MKLAKTIQLDVSDLNIFANPARPDEWAIAGTFAFVDSDLSALDNKQTIAFKSGWLGLESFGYSTLVRVVVIPDSEYEQLVRKLAEYLFRTFGAPDMLVALEAARRELDDMATLCDHPAGTLLAIGRAMEPDGISEQVRKIANPDGESHARIWEITEE